jgi:outer membrane lipoprotein carrier protein
MLNIKTKRRIPPVFIGLALMALACVAHADQAPTGAARLQAFLDQVHSLTANFTETILDANLKTVKRSRGTLAIKRPDRFRWDYRKPNKQVIVADGKHIWIYDVELQQVTVKPLKHTLASSPAALLAGSNSIRKHFIEKNVGRSHGRAWVKLKPKVKDSDFKYVRLGFRGKDLSVLELHDRLGQTTRIRLSDVKRNPAIPDKVFKFTPPPGADVIGALPQKH